MKKPNRSKAVRDYMYAHPAATADEIAAACSVKKQFVHQVKHEMRKRASIPIRTYRKTTLTKNVEPSIVKVDRTPEKDKPKEDALLSNNQVSDLIVDFVDQECTINSLKEEIIGYKAIIDFLEFQLGLRRNNGATV